MQAPLGHRMSESRDHAQVHRPARCASAAVDSGAHWPVEEAPLRQPRPRSMRPAGIQQLRGAALADDSAAASRTRPCPRRPGRHALNRNAVLLRAVPSRRSEAIARIAPAPAHMPSTAAMIGCGQARMALTRSPVIRVKASRPGISSLVSGPMISWTSPPEQKFSPAPCDDHCAARRAHTAAAGTDRAARRRTRRSAGSSCSGRLNVMVATAGHRP